MGGVMCVDVLGVCKGEFDVWCGVLDMGFEIG